MKKTSEVFSRRRITALLVRGPHAPFIAADIEDLYGRERARGLSWWRAEWRYARRVCDSSFHIWRGDRPPTRFGGGSMLQDFRFALRLFRKHPVPVGIAIGGLALAIGVVSSVFTIVDATMLKPYGMDEPSSVVSVGSANFHGFAEWSYSTFLKMHDEATLSRIEASRLNSIRFSPAPGADEDVSRRAQFVSGGYLQMLGGRPVLGRALEPSDDAPGAPLVAVVSHQFWSSVLNRDPDAAGKTIWLNDVAVSVVGVLRPEFNGPVDPRPAMWVPLAAFDDLIGGAPFDATSRASVTVIGRLVPGATRRAAQDNLSAIVTRVTAGASSAARDPRAPVILFSAASPIDGRDAAEYYLGIACIFGIVGLVLAVACANTANLLLAAAATRIKEMGVRLALGASTRRLIRQMVNESVLLALIAGGLGFLFALWFAPVLGTLLNVSPEFSAAPDVRVLVFTIAVALVCGLGAGLSPARHGARGNVLAALKSQHGGQPVAGRSRLRTSFVGFQAAVSIFLLVAAALFARTATIMSRTEAGFDADRMLTVSTGARTGFNAAAYFQAAAAAVRDVPSVERVSVIQHVPWGWSLHRASFTHGLKSYQVNVNVSDEQFFQAAGVRIVRGRAFTREEVEQEAPVALVSESVARAFFRDSDPIGQSLSTVPSASFQLEPASIIGVVADAQLTPMDAQIYGSVYRPIPHLSTGDPEKSENVPGLVIRTVNPARAARAVENALRRIDPRVRPETSVVSERMASYLDSKRMFAWLSVPTALLAVLLAVLGVMGVTAFAVTQRMHEVSVRLAMGASAGDVRWLLLRDNLRPVVIGLGVGLFMILIGARLTARMFDLSGISPHDPIAVGGATSVLILGALIAVILPARRAAKADPARLLRSL